MRFLRQLPVFWLLVAALCQAQQTNKAVHDVLPSDGNDASTDQQRGPQEQPPLNQAVHDVLPDSDEHPAVHDVLPDDSLNAQSTPDGDLQKPQHRQQDQNRKGHFLSLSSAKSVFAPRTDLVAASTSQPVATFAIRLGLVRHSATVVRAPTANEMKVLLCQVHRFVDQRLRNQTHDDGVESRLDAFEASSLGGKTLQQQKWQVGFQLHATFGSNSKSVSPWTLMRIFHNPPQDEVFRLVKDYLWPLTDTVFVDTRTLAMEGELSRPKATKPQWQDLLDDCPDPPPPLADNGNDKGQDNVFVHQDVQINQRPSHAQGIKDANSKPEEAALVTATPMDNRDADNLHTPSYDKKNKDDKTVMIHRNRASVTVSFWIANDQGIANGTWVQSKWLDPSFPRLVDLAVVTTLSSGTDDNNNHNATNMPQVIPDSAMIVQVTPMECPTTTTTSTADWVCHWAIARYDVTIQAMAIPMRDPSIYSPAIRAAIETGVYEKDILSKTISSSDSSRHDVTVRVGYTLEGLHNLDQPHGAAAAADGGAAAQTADKENDATATIAIAASIISVFFLLLLTGVVMLQWRIQRTLQQLQEERENTLWELEALLLAPTTIPEGAAPSVEGNVPSPIYDPPANASASDQNKFEWDSII